MAMWNMEEIEIWENIFFRIIWLILFAILLVHGFWGLICCTRNNVIESSDFGNRGAAFEIVM